MVVGVADTNANRDYNLNYYWALRSLSLDWLPVEEESEAQKWSLGSWTSLANLLIKLVGVPVGGLGANTNKSIRAQV